jgi:hypothetical protein
MTARSRVDAVFLLWPPTFPDFSTLQGRAR